MNPKNTLTWEWLITYVRDVIGYSALSFVAGFILSIIPMMALSPLFENPIVAWLIVSVSIAIFGGLVHNHQIRKRSEIEVRANESDTELNRRIRRLEYELSKKQGE